MNKVLIDTDILIDHLRGLDKAKEYLKKIESGKVKGVISVITEAELSAGESMRDILVQMKVRRLVRILEKVEVTSEIAWKAGELRRDYKCRLMDALIAATAMKLNLKLVTRNIKHYERIKGLEIEEPY
ncbi:MAG: type II toxin-antitoxin system VapC family toxin [Methanophagales archaeon]|nr:type II toxin-antitoxin system VapC family toxin [Methanophagales archaeon]